MTDIAGKGFLQVYTHNLKVVGSNPTPAANVINALAALMGGFLWAQREPNDIVFLAFKRFSKRVALLYRT